MSRDFKRDALRLMFLLEAGKTANTSIETSSDYPFVFRGEKRLQAMDFWVRYPDYLALELIAQYEQTGDLQKLEQARRIEQQGEPDLRTVPMLRRHFGAYEPMDTALAMLECRGLVKPERRKTPVGYAHVFYLNHVTAEFSAKVVDAFPLLAWYHERSALVAEVAGPRRGNELKAAQHDLREYHDTEIMNYIPTITDLLKSKLAQFG